MSQFKINSITDKTGTSGPIIAGVSTNNSTGCMIIPAGPTEHRGGRGRLVFGGGYDYPSPYTELGTMDMVEISTLGNAVDFGDFTQARYAHNMGSSGTRGIMAAGGYPGNPTNRSQVIDYVTFQSGGGASDFGEMSVAPIRAAGFGNGVRGVFAGGYIGSSPYQTITTMQYVNIATLGNSIVAFGEINKYTAPKSGGNKSDMSVADRTRGCIGGLQTYFHPATTSTNSIVFVTTATLGDSQDFGDLTIARTSSNGVSSSTTRGLFYSGSPGPTAAKNTIDYITIQTKGNAVNFGDMTTSGNSGGSNHGSNLTRSVNHDSGGGNTIEYVTITTLGNTQDFGDLTVARVSYAGLDNSNGSIA